MAERTTPSAFDRHQTLLLNSCWEPTAFPPEILDGEATVGHLFAETAVGIVYPRRAVRARSAGGLAMEMPSVMALTRYGEQQLYKPLPFDADAMFYRDGFMCMYEGRVMSKNALTVEHLVPQSRLRREGAPKSAIHSFLNCVSASRRANNRKGDKTPEEADMHPLIAPWDPRGIDLLRMWMEVRRDHNPPEWNDVLEQFMLRQRTPVMDRVIELRRDVLARQAWAEAKAA